MKIELTSRKKITLFILALVATVIMTYLIVSHFRPRFLAAPQLDVTLIELPDDAPIEAWRGKLYTHWDDSEGHNDGDETDKTPMLAYHGRFVNITFFNEDLYGALLRAHMSASGTHKKGALAIICTSKFKLSDLKILQTLETFARANDIQLLPATNTPSVAGLFLLSPHRALIYPWVLFLILFGGAAGGLFYALTLINVTPLTITVPLSGRVVNTGIVGHMSIGAGAGAVLVALAVRGFGLDIDPLFHWPYESDGVRSLIQLLAVSIIGGYLGIKLLDKVSKQVLDEIEKEQKEQKEIQTKMAEQLKVQTQQLESQRLQLKEQTDQLNVQNEKLSDNLALNAKALYSSNYGKNGDGIESRIGKEVEQLAERSNSIRENALATAMLAELKRVAKDYEGAADLYAKAIKLLPDINLIKPQNVRFNRACVLSLLKDPKRINLILTELEEFLNMPGARAEGIISDPDLEWIRSQPEFPNKFRNLTVPPIQPNSPT